jgi:hypothetical protein
MLSHIAPVICCVGIFPPFAFQPAYAQVQGEQQLRLLSDAIQKRRNQFNPIWVRYRLDITESGKYLSQVKPGYTGGEQKTKFSCQYARKGTRIKAAAKRDEGTMLGWLDELFYTYTGEISIWPTNEKHVYNISKNPREEYPIEKPPHLLIEDQINHRLNLWTQRQLPISGITSLEEKVVNGECTSLLAWSYPKTKWKSRCLTVPGQDWIIKTYQDDFPSGKIGILVEVTEYRTSGGLYYPQTGSRTDYFEDGTIQRRVAFEVDQLETQDSKIPDSLFQYDFPKGSQIWDDDLKVMVRNTELTESHLAEVVRHAASARSVPAQWLAALLCLANISVLTVLLFTWMRRAQNKARG